MRWPAMTPGSVTGWLEGLRAGNDEAAQRLWEVYFRRLVVLARHKLGGLPRGPADSEDIALSAFDSFCRAVEGERFPRLADRHDLWQVLVLLTARKAIDLIRRERAAKRGGAMDPAGGPFLEDLVGTDPTPSFAAEMVDQYRMLLDRLPDTELRTIANQKLEGRTNSEIALSLGRSVATVERKLQLIRRLWEAAVDG